MFRKIFRYVLIALSFMGGVLLLFIIFSVIPIDFTSYKERSFYDEMQNHFNALEGLTIPEAKHGFVVGFAKTNITPHIKTSIAGSGPRKLAFKSIHDSIYVRAIVIGNGTQTVALVTADLLLIPPTVTRVLKDKLPSIGFTIDNVYLSAVHTHSSVGNWGEHLAGEIYSGPYRDSLVQFIADNIIQSIHRADQHKLPASLKEGVIPTKNILYNRLADDQGDIDSLLRVIEIQRADSSKLVLTSFTGHATCATSDNTALSRDYPGVLVDSLEHSGYTFAMFMAGAVGSHACKGRTRGWDRVNYIGKYLASVVLQNKDSLKPINDSTLVMISVPLELGDPQLKISKSWRVRPWLFNAVFGKYPAYLNALRIGNVVMLGTPCDFSGELMPAIDSAAERHGLDAVVTSFNGGYIGYITRDKWYDIDHYETRIMNWYGPGNGAYLSECLISMIDLVDERKD